MYTERAKTKILGELLPFTFFKKILAEIEGSCFFSKHTCINHENTVQRPAHVQVHSGSKQRKALPPDYLHKGPWRIEKIQLEP